MNIEPLEPLELARRALNLETSSSAASKFPQPSTLLPQPDNPLPPSPSPLKIEATMMDWTSIALAVITLLGGCGWMIDRKKHRQEVEGLKADNRQKDMNLSRDYVTEWRTCIAEPLQREVGELRQKVAELKYAIERIADCPHSGHCPVREQLLHKSLGSD